VTGTRGEGDGLLENGNVIETLTAITANTVSQRDQMTVGETDFVIIRNNVCQRDQPAVIERDTVTFTDTVCHGAQLTVGITETGFSCDNTWHGHQPSVSETEYVIINGIRETDAVIIDDSVGQGHQLGFRETDAVISRDTVSQVDQQAVCEISAITTDWHDDQPAVSEPVASITGDSVSHGHQPTNSVISTGDIACQDYRPVISKTSVINGDMEQAVSQALETSVGNSDLLLQTCVASSQHISIDNVSNS